MRKNYLFVNVEVDWDQTLCSWINIMCITGNTNFGVEPCENVELFVKRTNYSHISVYNLNGLIFTYAQSINLSSSGNQLACNQNRSYYILLALIAYSDTLPRGVHLPRGLGTLLHSFFDIEL